MKLDPEAVISIIAFSEDKCVSVDKFYEKFLPSHLSSTSQEQWREIF